MLCSSAISNAFEWHNPWILTIIQKYESLKAFFMVIQGQRVKFSRLKIKEAIINIMNYDRAKTNLKTPCCPNRKDIKNMNITLISSNFFSFIKELKCGIWMNINFGTHRFTNATINLSNLYLILSFHRLPEVIPQRPQVLTEKPVIIIITRNTNNNVYTYMCVYIRTYEFHN